MDVEKRRKEIRKHYFQTWNMVIISILGIFGLLMVYYSGILGIKDSSMLYECIYKNGMIIILGVFFFMVSLCCWLLFYLNIILPPKREVLYLNKIDDGKAVFLNKKGKSFNYTIDQIDLQENSYYHVLKTHNYIYIILEKTNDSWIPKEKISYWLNYYSPVGNIENMYLLPIIYVILLIAFLSFLMSKGYQKIYGVIFCLVPLYGIIYDLIYKIKLMQSDNKEIDETNFIKSYEILKNTLSIIASGVFVIIFLIIFFKLQDLTSKLIFLPFVCCGICNFGSVFAKIIRKHRIEKFFLKGYLMIFFAYWFGVLFVWTFSVVKEGKNYVFLLLSIPFWILGVIAFYKYIIKNK